MKDHRKLQPGGYFKVGATIVRDRQVAGYRAHRYRQTRLRGHNLTKHPNDRQNKHEQRSERFLGKVTGMNFRITQKLYLSRTLESLPHLVRRDPPGHKESRTTRTVVIDGRTYTYHGKKLTDRERRDFRRLKASRANNQGDNQVKRKE